LEARPEEHDAVAATSMSIARSTLVYALGALLTTTGNVGSWLSSRATIAASNLTGKQPLQEAVLPSTWTESGQRTHLTSPVPVQVAADGVGGSARGRRSRL